LENTWGSASYSRSGPRSSLFSPATASRSFGIGFFGLQSRFCSIQVPSWPPPWPQQPLPESKTTSFGTWCGLNFYWECNRWSCRWSHRSSGGLLCRDWL
jgi:hypothetical protein